MLNNTYKCGNSGAVLTAALPAKPVAATPRLKVAVHFTPIAPMANGVRVVARLAGGTDTVVLVGDTVEFVTANVFAWALPEGSVALTVEKWEGTFSAGRWTKVSAPPGALPKLPRLKPARERNRLARRKPR